MTNHGAASATSLSFRGKFQQNYCSYLSRPAFVSGARPNFFAVFAGEATSTAMDHRRELRGEHVMNGEEKDEKEDGLVYEDVIRACDKLIEVFMVDMPTPTDWRRLLAFSKEWNSLRPHFFKRCLDRAGSDNDPDMKLKLHRLARKLKEIDEDVQRHNELLEAVKAAPIKLKDIIPRRRKDFTQEFFEHLYTVAASYYDNPTEHDAYMKIGDLCLTAVQAYDVAIGDTEAQSNLQDISNFSSANFASSKIDSISQRTNLNSAYGMMMNKAWSDTKETDITVQECKDMLFDNYLDAKIYLQESLPKEVRILKHILPISDPETLLCTLKDAFTPGFELEGTHVDYLYTTPEKLRHLMKHVVAGYNLNQKGAVMSEVRDLLRPSIIEKLEMLIQIVESKFM